MCTKLLRHTFVLATLLFGACNDPDTEPQPTPAFIDPDSDVDGDGVLPPQDCNNYDAQINPQAVELCGNGLDDDCSGTTDCDDSECWSDPICDALFSTPEICGNGFDDDENGAVDCADPACDHHVSCSVCNITASGSCNHLYNAWSHQSASNLSITNCGNNHPGPETIYEFLSITTESVTVTVIPDNAPFGFGNDVALYILEGTCFPDRCVDYVNSGAQGTVESITFTALPWTYYFIVVEDIGGPSADFTISVGC